ncbi:MAG: diphosphomevalonate decarboxylase [Spirochaeta sp.]
MIRVHTEPSLALIKYWGKADGGVNLPATTSLAVSLGGLSTVTEIQAGESRTEDAADTIRINKVQVHDPKIHGFLQHVRRTYPALRNLGFAISTTNSFPTAAGIASSSSGFAALAIGITRAAGLKLSALELSELARHGSGSAARAVYGGFTSFPAGSETAHQLFDHTHWPELRIVVIMVHAGAKPIGSREAMERTRLTSPYYRQWIEASRELEAPALNALKSRNLADLGPIMRRSYLSMFGSMLAADPGVVYWLPESIRLIHSVAEWRKAGMPVWETMDAGPQVKLVTTADHLPSIESHLRSEFPRLAYLTASVGQGPVVDEHPGRSI